MIHCRIIQVHEHEFAHNSDDKVQFEINVIISSAGDIIPADSILHFDVLLLDVWSPDDSVQINTYYTPSVCSRKVEVSDYVRYHYNGTLLDGTLFDSRFALCNLSLSQTI